MALHRPSLVGFGQIEVRILEPSKVEHPLLQEVRVRLACRVGQGLRQQVEAEIGIEDTGPRRE
jgi:hypothetical protein